MPYKNVWGCHSWLKKCIEYDGLDPPMVAWISVHERAALTRLVIAQENTTQDVVLSSS